MPEQLLILSLKLLRTTWMKADAQTTATRVQKISQRRMNLIQDMNLAPASAADAARYALIRYVDTLSRQRMRAHF